MLQLPEVCKGQPRFLWNRSHVPGALHSKSPSGTALNTVRAQKAVPKGLPPCSSGPFLKVPLGRSDWNDCSSNGQGRYERKDYICPNCQTKLWEAGPPKSDSDPHDVFQGPCFYWRGSCAFCYLAKGYANSCSQLPHSKHVPGSLLLPTQRPSISAAVIRISTTLIFHKRGRDILALQCRGARGQWKGREEKEGEGRGWTSSKACHVQSASPQKQQVLFFPEGLSLTRQICDSQSPLGQKMEKNLSLNFLRMLAFSL